MISDDSNTRSSTVAEGDSALNPFAERIRSAVSATDIPQLYINGFVNNLSNSDVFVILERNGVPVGVLNMSFTIAKSLIVALGQTIAQLEQATGRDMLTAFEVENALKNASQSSLLNGDNQEMAKI